MKKLLIVLLSTMFLLGIGLSAQASLITDTADIGHYKGGTPVKLTANVTATPQGVTDFTYNASASIGYSADLYDDTIGIAFVANTSSGTSSFNYPSYDFVGLKITGLDDSYHGASISTNLAGWDDSRLTFGVDYVAINLNGLSFNSGSTLTATMHNPIPAPILLLGTGLVGLAGFRRKAKK